MSEKLGEMIKQFGGSSDTMKNKMAKNILELDTKVKKMIAAANSFLKNPQMQTKPPGAVLSQVLGLSSLQHCFI